jgi:hypothetical protein
MSWSCLIPQVQVVGYLHDWQPTPHHGGTFVYYNSNSPEPDVRSDLLGLCLCLCLCLCLFVYVCVVCLCVCVDFPCLAVLYV